MSHLCVLPVLCSEPYLVQQLAQDTVLVAQYWHYNITRHSTVTCRPLTHHRQQNATDDWTWNCPQESSKFPKHCGDYHHRCSHLDDAPGADLTTQGHAVLASSSPSSSPSLIVSLIRLSVGCVTTSRRQSSVFAGF